MASGELGASFHIYRNHAMVSAERGSAVGWVPMELVPTNCGLRRPWPPNRRTRMQRLFSVDFLLGRGAQSSGEIPIRSSVNELPFKRWHPGFGKNAETI